MKMLGLPHTKIKCDCQLCKTTRKFKRIIAKLPPKQKEWMNDFYNAAFEAGAELELIKASVIP